jgi:thiol-disulfide isomerase/thioredoxin
MKRKVISIISLLILLGILISIGMITYRERKDVFPTTSEGVGSEIDRLLKEMGIVKAPQLINSLEINLKDVHGRMVKLSDFRGKVVFINFWATWCPPCREEMPSMERLHQRLKERDFVMVGINLQEPASLVRAFFKKFKLTFVSLLDSDGTVMTRFGIRSIPTTIILDKEGILMGAAIGARKWDDKRAIALFKLLTEKG